MVAGFCRWSSALILASLGLAACAPVSQQPADEGKYLHAGFVLNEHLASSLPEVTAADLPKMLQAPWRQAFGFGGLSGEQRQVSSCRAYGDALNAGLRPALEADYTLLAELAVMCRAACAMSDARAARESHIGTLPFNGQLPILLPADLALRASTEDHARFAAAEPEARWAEVASLKSVEIHGPEYAVYRQLSGDQVVRLVGRGDVDGDGVEDLLLTSKDVGSDGSLLGYRLFTITRFSPETPYVVLSEFAPN